MNRIEASKLGLKIYDADEPCRYGHEPKRYVSTGACIQCQRIASERYRRQFVTTSRADTHVAPRVFVSTKIVEKVDKCLSDLALGHHRSELALDFWTKLLEGDPRSANLLAMWELQR